VAAGLVFDLGRPWNIWRPMFFWQHHSALFEVAWCVMLYLTVLGLEFAPVPLESSKFHRLTKALKSASLPLVILGIMLSTLHQSSLGTLFLIAPARVHPLWYTPLLPFLFFLSAVALGMGMVIVESKASAWLYRRHPEDRVLSSLLRPLGLTLLLYAGIRIGDLLVRGQGARLADGSWESALLWFELCLSALVPAAFALSGLARRSGRALFATGLMVVTGFVLHRIDVGGVSGVGLTDSGYFPSVFEISLSLGVVSVAILLFLFFVERFRVYAPEPAPAGPPAAWRAPLAVARAYSSVFVVGAAIAFALLPGGAVFGANPLSMPVLGARRVLAVEATRTSPPGKMLLFVPRGAADAREVLLVDGNRAGEYALFDHDAHIKRQDETEGCGNCHHLNRPNDRETACYECHRDAWQPTDLFRHGAHIEATGGNRGCGECHLSPAAPKTRAATRPCRECHGDMVATGKRELVPPPAADSPFMAPGYVDAMHGTCRKCHEEEDRTKGVKVPELALCSTCHPEAVDLSPRPTGGKD
jgi:formate-dependent nitrite reductase membrane component NrfD